ncbi:EAL domain-containing protein [Geomonas sp. Red69]|uniref:EAL domain-containing protein n=2 Tax=Geomonas diazotrophica TaxID=2843197 RepID=A0ABX8JT77_9BACT|nr:EAL domain-containing protein [Geomonas diazotrophica]QWV99807.1 EAL domain-containing protein [Geomonas nitrogeniifigens]QXE88948.1 EAL domain-containing protein [Geomonas nitrogeniifigens]
MEAYLNDEEDELRPELVLVADDDEMMRDLAVAALEQAGFFVALAENGAVALEQFRQLQPDIVLLDVMMPEMDGFSTCRALRALPAGGDVPILMMTGLDDTRAIEQAYHAGATDFITKPIHWAILRHRVRYMLRSSKAMRDLRVSEARLSNAHRIAHMGSWEWDILNDKFYWSQEISNIFTVDPVGFDSSYPAFLNTIHPLDKELFNKAFEDACAYQRPISLDHQILLPRGDERYCHTEGEVGTDESGRVVRISGTIQDITERKRIEDQVRSLAYYDSITGLPNRVLFGELLERALTFARRYRKKVAILFLDLDRFKEINDTLGHAVGDDLLREVSERLKRCIRGYDSVWQGIGGAADGNPVARLGGDEFTVIMEDIQDSKGVIAASQRILQLLSDPFLLDDVEICVTASIGISIYPDDGEDAMTLVKNADTAMYHAKKEGRNNAQFFMQALNDAACERLLLERQLRKALANEEFVLYYQPQIDAGKGRIVGLEALIRWQSPELGFVPPASFIPFAEESGQIMLIDEWVVHAVCRQIAAWSAQGITPPRVAVNLSGCHFLKKSLVEMVGECLQNFGLEGRHLEVELTEGVIMRDVEQATATLAELKGMGVTVSIDDFGTGYSSLSYLRRFPIDTLKIDRSFITGVTKDADGAAIATAIISMATSMRLEIVAEGVETAEQMTFLLDHGCAVMQGYLFCRPVPPEELTPFLVDGLPMPERTGG